MDQAKQFAVNWSNHMAHIKQAFDNLLNNNDFTDVTLYVEGRKIGAHKMLLSACSNYFKDLFHEFPEEHPIVVLKGVRCSVLEDILKFIYNGEVNVDSNHFNNFLQTAEFLQISGFTDTQNYPEYESGIVNGTSLTNSSRVKLKKRKRCPNSKEEKDFNTTFTNICDIQLESQDLTDCVADEIVVKKEITEEDPPDNAQESIPVDNLTCPICFKVFTHPYSLHHHKPVHLGRTKCPICNVVLSRKYNLKMHLKSKHNVA
ncbi:unnamed protein product [Phyllotreta striolata]|uniref:Broad-complex core protein n=1 Tax=Phyllotreta striolata TaxID=444603 RepID=A0A9N9TXZ2_PHYSR|nr:unnamed protein product [Phyllotreta striolata]